MVLVSNSIQFFWPKGQKESTCQILGDSEAIKVCHQATEVWYFAHYGYQISRLKMPNFIGLEAHLNGFWMTIGKHSPFRPENVMEFETNSNKNYRLALSVTCDTMTLDCKSLEWLTRPLSIQRSTKKKSFPASLSCSLPATGTPVTNCCAKSKHSSSIWAIRSPTTKYFLR